MLFGIYVNNTAPAATPITIGTVPSGKKWLLKDWSFYNASGGSRQCLVFLKSGATTCVIDSGTAAGSGVIGNNNRHVVLNAGDILQVQFQTTGASHFQASGAQLG